MPYNLSTFEPKNLNRRSFLKKICGGIIASGMPTFYFSSGCRRTISSDHLNVILITLDTTRSDRLGCYGYKRNTSPHIDRLAEQSVLYTQATATSSWTLPSHASLFTGKFTSSHGARYDPEGPLRLTSALKDKSEWNQKFRARGLAENERTLAEVLKQKGFTTGAVVSGPWMKKIFGLNTGFDYYNDDNISSFHSKRASEVTSQALSWIKTIYDKPFFLFLNGPLN